MAEKVEWTMFRAALASIALLALVGCSTAPLVVNLVVDPGNASLTIGETVRLSAMVTGTQSQSVAWTTTGGQLLAKGANATFVAVAAGEFVVTVTSLADETVSATAEIVVSSPPAEPHIVFTSDRSVLLGAGVQDASLEVVIVGADGLPVAGGQVVWTSSDEAVVTVEPAGDRAAVVTLVASATAIATITASFEGLSADATALATTPSAGTVLIPSAWVLTKSAEAVTLVRNPTTEALAPGQRLVSGDRAGVLSEIASVSLSGDEVEVGTSPTSLAEAFDELAFTTDVAPVEIEVQLTSGGAVISATSDGREVLSAVFLDDVTCTTSGGAAAPVDLVGATLDITAQVFGELTFSVLLGDDQFLAKLGASVTVGATTGSVAFSGAVEGPVSCSLELPRIALEPVSAAAFTVWIGLIPILGVEIEASGAVGSLSLSGPTGGLGAVLEGGIQYTEGGGWEPLSSSQFNADFAPFSTTVSLGAPFSARLAPFGQVDFGLGFDLGVGPLKTSILDARFVELKGYAYLDFSLPAPVEVASEAYHGPEWQVGVGASGALKAEFQGILPELLSHLGIDVNFAGQLPLFELSEELDQSPSLLLLALPGEVEIPEGGSEPVSLMVSTDAGQNGTASFWLSKDGSPLSFLTSAAIVDGEAATTWFVSEPGEYEIHARMSTDLASQDKPYAAANLALVSVTVEEENGGGTGPLGEDGPWGGYFTYFSPFGNCYELGYGLTINFHEAPNGDLTGSYVGHACDELCLDLDLFPTGPLAGTLSGKREANLVTFLLSAPIGGLFEGDYVVPEAPPGQGSLPSVFGYAEGVLPCEDSHGSHNAGFFTFVGSKVIMF